MLISLKNLAAAFGQNKLSPYMMGVFVLSMMSATILFTGAATGVFALTPLISILITIGSALSALLLLTVGVNLFIVSCRPYIDLSSFREIHEAAKKRATAFLQTKDAVPKMVSAMTDDGIKLEINEQMDDQAKRVLLEKVVKYLRNTIKEGMMKTVLERQKNVLFSLGCVNKVIAI